MAKVKERIEEFKPDPRLIDERGATQEAISKFRQSPVNVALARGQITRQQGIAAEKYYGHWYRAGLSENFGSVDLNSVFGGDGGGATMARSEAQAFHRQRYRQAVEKIGLRGSWVLERVICREMSFEDTGREMGWNNRPQAVASAVQVARDSLDILCAEWGII